MAAPIPTRSQPSCQAPPAGRAPAITYGNHPPTTPGTTTVKIAPRSSSPDCIRALSLRLLAAGGAEWIVSRGRRVDQFGDPLGSRLGPFRAVQPIEELLADERRQRVEPGPGRLVLRQCLVEILRNDERLDMVDDVPAA